MTNPIEEMRDRLSEQFSGTRKPITGLRVTANDMPRLPQSSIPNSKARQDRAGRPAKAPARQLPENTPLQRKKPRDIWGGWL